MNKTPVAASSIRINRNQPFIKILIYCDCISAPNTRRHLRLSDESGPEGCQGKLLLNLQRKPRAAKIRQVSAMESTTAQKKKKKIV